MSVEKIQYLYKDERYPAVPIENGFGEYGVIERDTEKEKIRCHECGEWFGAVHTHISIHGLTAREYKIKYGFDLKTPLQDIEVSKSQSVKRKRYAKRNLKVLNGRLEKARKKTNNNKIFIGTKKRIRRPSMQFKNEHNLCPAQMKARYEIVCMQIGNKEAREIDVHKYDNNLRVQIRRTHKTFNDFRRKIGHFKNMRKAYGHRFSKKQIIAELRDFYYKFKKIPTIRNFRHGKTGMSSATIHRRFGSWNNALVSAGLK